MNREEILARLRERIVAFAASRIARDVAEDLAQEVLMVLHDKYAEVERMEELVPLSLQIMRYKMVAVRRKAYRRGESSQVSVDDVQLPDLHVGPAAYVERKEMLDRMKTAIRELGDRCRNIFRLKLLGRTFAEIQAELKADSINTVYTWDLRCRKQLLEKMGGRWRGKSERPE
jgi:RNA polymerase sigma-70 factor (ECF subfamily)